MVLMQRFLWKWKQNVRSYLEYGRNSGNISDTKWGKGASNNRHAQDVARARRTKITQHNELASAGDITRVMKRQNFTKCGLQTHHFERPVHVRSAKLYNVEPDQ